MGTHVLPFLAYTKNAHMFSGFRFCQIVVLPDLVFPNHGFAKSRFCQTGFSPKSRFCPNPSSPNHGSAKSGFHQIAVCRIMVLLNLFCPYKTDSAWANRHSRFAIRSAAEFCQPFRHAFCDLVLSESGFCRFVVLSDHSFARSWFCQLSFPEIQVLDFARSWFCKTRFLGSRFCQNLDFAKSRSYAWRIGVADSPKIPAQPESVMPVAFLRLTGVDSDGVYRDFGKLRGF
jgi:hypothetical protein